MNYVFYARFEQANWATTSVPSGLSVPLPMVTVAEVRPAFLRKATGLDRNPVHRPTGQCSRTSLVSPYSVLRCPPTSKRPLSSLYQRKARSHALNDYYPIAMICTIMKCFERLVMAHLTSSLLSSLNPPMIPSP